MIAQNARPFLNDVVMFVMSTSLYPSQCFLHQACRARTPVKAMISGTAKRKCVDPVSTVHFHAEVSSTVTLTIIFVLNIRLIRYYCDYCDSYLTHDSVRLVVYMC